MDRFGLNLDLPFIHRQHSHIGHDNGQNVWESWNFSGLGDLIVSGQLGLLLPAGGSGPSLNMAAGVKLATGQTDVKNSDGETAEVTIQPGTGSTDAIMGLYFRQNVLSVPTLSGKFSALPLQLGISYQANGKGTDDYRFGNVVLAHLGSVYQFLDHASLPFQVNAKFQDFADVGSTGEPRENTGGTWIFLSPGLNVNMTDTFSAYSFIQIPIYQNVHGLQQTARFNLQIGLTASVSII